MKTLRNYKTILAVTAALVVLGAGILAGAAAASRPKSIIHVVTIKWKDETTPEQKRAVFDGLAKVVSEIEGVKNVWLKATRVQPVKQSFPDAYMEDGYAIEFADRAAEQRYEKSPQRKAWLENIYYPIRERSYSVQITNE